MAKIIRLNLSRINQAPQTTQRSVAQAGMVGRELSNLGQTIVGTGLKIGSLIERRRAEDARDRISTESAINKITSSQESEDMKLQFASDSRGFADTLGKQQEKRHNKILKGIDNPLAKEKLQERFELSRMEARLDSVAYERTQFTKNSIINLASVADTKSKVDYESPSSESEFMLDLAIDLQDIESRDLDDITKQKISERTIDTRLNGIVFGYMKGGGIQDFIRAERLVDSMGSRLSAKKVDILKKRITNERMRVLNLKVFNERQEKIALEKRFNVEKHQLRNIFQSVIEDPNADVSDQLKIFKSQGKISNTNFRLTSEVKMSEIQIARSADIKLGLLESLSETSTPRAITDALNQVALDGTLSAEDADQVLESILVRTDKSISRQAYTRANALLKESVSTGFGINRFADKGKLSRMIFEREKLVRRFALDPITASKIILKEEGKSKLSRIGNATMTGDQNSLKGIEEMRSNLVLRVRSGAITKKEAKVDLRILNRRKRVIQELDEDVPSIQELKESRQ